MTGQTRKIFRAQPYRRGPQTPLVGTNGCPEVKSRNDLGIDLDGALAVRSGETDQGRGEYSELVPERVDLASVRIATIIIIYKKYIFFTFLISILFAL